MMLSLHSIGRTSLMKVVLNGLSREFLTEAVR